MPNHVINYLYARGSVSEVKRLYQFVESDAHQFDFNNIIPCPDNIYQGDLGRAEMEKYGKNNWYDWNIDHWGTKWNAYETTAFPTMFVSEGVDMAIGGFCFQTAWSRPQPIYDRLTELFPDLEFCVLWADEDIGYNCGTMTLEGETYLCDEYEFSLPEADRESFALMLWNPEIEPENLYQCVWKDWDEC